MATQKNHLNEHPTYLQFYAKNFVNQELCFDLITHFAP